MRAHLVQLDIQWESPELNFERVRSLINDAGVEAGDLIALPEMFDSGFSLKTQITCDKHGRTLAFLSALANDTHCTIHGSRSMLPKDHTLACNCATIFHPGAHTPACEYAKIHPFSYGRESESFQGGTQLGQYTWQAGDESLTVCPVICYDLRFPELFRKGTVNGADMFVCGANWPDTRQHHWRTLLIARAIENQSFVLGINRCGSDPHLSYAGGSIVVNPKGEVLGELDEKEGVLSVEIHPAEVHEWRTTFPALKDITIRSF